jgi:acyl carrier protein
MHTESTRLSVRDAVLAAYRETVGGDPPHGLHTAADQVADWSSLAQIRLLYAIEQELDCVLDERYLSTGHTRAEMVDAACVAIGVKDDW